MIDTVQIVLLAVIVVLAILLLILGVQVYFILREVRRTLLKANKVLDDTGTITRSVTGPISSVASLVEGISTGALFSKIVKIAIRTLTKHDDGEEERGDTKRKT